MLTGVHKLGDGVELRGRSYIFAWGHVRTFNATPHHTLLTNKPSIPIKETALAGTFQAVALTVSWGELRVTAQVKRKSLCIPCGN